MSDDFFSRIAEQAAEKYTFSQAPAKVTPLLDIAFGNSPVSSLLDVAQNIGLGAIRDKFGGIASGAVQALLNGDQQASFSLTGGITLNEARQIYKRAAKTNYAKTNLFLISIVDLRSNGEALDINFFCTAVDYTPITISSAQMQTGSAAFRGRTNQELTDFRLTTLDDSAGTIKSWFAKRAARMVNGDGTFGVPMDYLMKIRITHAYTKEMQGAYTDEFVVQPGTVEYSLTRRDDALQEVQMTLHQFDNFSKLK